MSTDATLSPINGAHPTLNANMDRNDSSHWHKADGWTNGDPFNNGWQADNVSFNNGFMTLQLDNQGCPQACSERPYASGEYRTNSFYRYGLLEGRFKAAKGNGLVTSLFFYTGPSDGNPWDEIDVEILGKDPTKMQINYFTNGAGSHEAIIDLGFDASQAFHDYAIYWTPDSIRWYVDGKLVHTEDGSRGALPTHAGRIMMNLWPGIGVDGWLRPFSYSGPVRAQYDWVRFTPFSGPGAPAAAAPAAQPQPIHPVPSVTVELQPIPEGKICLPPDHPLRPGLPDPELGKMDDWRRPVLNRNKVEEKLGLEQLRAILAELANVSANRILDTSFYRCSNAEFDRVYPELENIKEREADCRNQAYWYLRDFRSYWDNAIVLLSVYVQKITENTEIDRNQELTQALAIAQNFEARIHFQQLADAATNKERSASIYSRAALDLIQAEIRSQTENQELYFYDEGITYIESAIQGFLSVEAKTDYPSKPDYLSITKAILVLGDLYAQMANLTLDPADYAKANYLYQRVAAMDEASGQGLSVYFDDLLLYLEVSPQKIHEALDFNLEKEYITAPDKELALRGIYYQLKGMAGIKMATLYITQPGPKTIDGVIEQFVNSALSMVDLRSTYLGIAPEKDAKNEFFYAQAKLIQGELLMALADRIKFYNHGMLSLADYPDLIWALEIVKHYFPEEETRFSVLETELPIGEANWLIDIARDYYYDYIPEAFKYAHAQSLIKQLEIAIRNADYVYEYKGKKFTDARLFLEHCDSLLQLIEKATAGRLLPDFLQIEFDYLKTILLVSGVPERRENGELKFRTSRTGRPILPKNTEIMRSLELFGKLEKEIIFLPAPLRNYFEINLIIKEAIAMTNISQEREYKSKPEVRQRIKEKTGKDMPPLKYALFLLKEVEKRIAPVFPPYLWYNLKITLPKKIEEGDFDFAQKSIINVLEIFINAKVKEFYSEAYPGIKEKLQVLKTGIRRRNAAESKEALNDLMQALAQLNNAPIAFRNAYAELAVWDMHNAYAELYHSLAIIYLIQKDGHSMTQYAMSAHSESKLSQSPYDLKYRPAFIFQGTDIKEDKDVGFINFCIEVEEHDRDFWMQ